MVMTLEEFKARIAQPEGLLLKPKRVPSSGHDATCHLRETGRYTAKCECCKALRRRALRRRRPREHRNSERLQNQFSLVNLNDCVTVKACSL